MFYNPAMALDRDLAVAFVSAWATRRGPPRTGWEVTAATGVRGLRIVGETGAFDRFLLTEAHPEAFQVLAENAARRPGVTARPADGRLPPPDGPFDYVDVDPFGSPIPFVPAALAAVAPGGVLAVTATDMMVLAGAQGAACLRRYGARPVRGRLGPEGGLRILLAYLGRSARERGRSVRPLLAYVHDHHVRAYLEVRDGPSASDPIATVEPSTWTGPRLAGAGPFGPLWLGPLFDADLVRTLVPPPMAARPREAASFLERLRDEVTVDRPFYYEPNELARECGLPLPPSLDALRNALTVAGFRSARTHARPEGLRTEAPHDTVLAAARAAARAA